jgi:hypothetical protein
MLKIVTETFIHIFESTSQDVNAVIGIIDSVFLEIKSQYGSKKIFYKADCAGCYKNKSLIPIMHFLAKKHDHILERIDFNEPNSGKDICDRKISPIRRIVQNYIDNGNNVTNASELKKAIDSNSSLRGVKAFVCKVNENCDFKNDFKFQNITNFHSFKYESDHLFAYRYYNIGTGKKIFYKDLLCLKNDVLTNKLNKDLLTIEEESLNKEFYEYALKDSNMKIFKCNKCSFITFCKNSLKEHSYIHIDESELDDLSKIKLEYSKLVGDFRSAQVSKSKNLKEEFFSDLKLGNDLLTQKGFGLKFISRERFSQKLIKFLTDIFEKGEKTGNIRSAKSAHQEMMEKGEFFNFDERKSEKQIKSFFSSLKTKQNKVIKKKILEKQKEEEEDLSDEYQTESESEDDERILGFNRDVEKIINVL